MRFSNVFGLLALVSVTVAGVLAGCGDDSASSTSGTTTSSSSGTAGPPCAPRDPVCTKVESDCIALEDNGAAAKPGLRMSQLTITAPELLSKGTVATLVGKGVEMNLEECNLAGDGTFSWILEIDPATGMMKTGGAKPVVNPVDGYCFVNEMLGTTPIAPHTFDSGLKDGKFGTTTSFDVTVPIFLNADGTSYVLMPLKEVKLEGQLSANNNCIGKYNADTLDPKANCAAEPPDSYAFTNAGKLEGYITLEDADAVVVETLMQSLCVLLSGNASMYGDNGSPAKCKRDMGGKIMFQGKWCSTTNAAADAMCADAERLSAEFAASAVKINGDCTK